MRSHHRIPVVVAVAALAVTGLTACSANDSGAGSGHTPIQFLGPEDPATFKPLISAFEDANPGYTVTYTQVPFDQLNSTLTQRLGAKDTSIDVYTVDQPRVAQFAAQGFLTDLSDLKNKAKAATSQPQYEANIYRGKMWALSVWNSTQLMFVNTDALAAAGVTPPTTDPAGRWTWEQTVQAAKDAQAAGVQWGLLPEQTDYYYQLQPLMESLGGGSGITGKDMLTPDVANPEWVKAMTWYHSLFADGIAPRGVGSFETAPLFNDGKVAFFIGGPWDLNVFKDAKCNWTIAPMPYFEGGKQVTPTGSWSWGINPASKNQDAARKFIEFAALNPAGNLVSTKTQTIVPANTEAAQKYLPTTDTLAGTKSAGAGKLISYEIDHTAVARPVSVGYVQFEDVMNKAFADIRNGADPAERLKQANGQLTDAWKQLK